MAAHWLNRMIHRLPGATVRVLDTTNPDDPRYAILVTQVDETGAPVAGGGATTIADGADVAEGAIADAAYVSGNGTVIALLKGIFGKASSGTLTDNGAAPPAATQSGVLTAIANAAQRLLTEGRQVLLSVDLANYLRVTPYVTQQDLTFVLDTSAYIANEVLSNTLVITNFFPVIDGTMWLNKFILLDKDDNTPYDIEAYFLGANVSLGTFNTAVSISDADAANIQTVVELPAASAKDLINGRLYIAPFAPIQVKPATGTRDLYVQLKIGAVGTPTHTASGIVAKVGGFR